MGRVLHSSLIRAWPLVLATLVCLQVGHGSALVEALDSVAAGPSDCGCPCEGIADGKDTTRDRDPEGDPGDEEPTGTCPPNCTDCDCCPGVRAAALPPPPPALDMTRHHERAIFTQEDPPSVTRSRVFRPPRTSIV